MTPQEILNKPLLKLTKDEQTRIANMAKYYKLYLAKHAYIPLQDLPKYEAAYQRLHPKKENTPDIEMELERLPRLI